MLYSGALIFSLLAVVFLIAVVYSSTDVDTASYSVIFLSAAIAVLAPASLFFALEALRYQRTSENALSESNFKYTIVLGELRQLFDVRTETTDTLFGLGTDDEAGEAAIAVESYINSVLHHGKRMMDALTGDNCSICVKLLDSPTGEIDASNSRISIVYRDAASAEKRSHRSNYSFFASENTAFRRIIERNPIGYYYYNNDLYRSYLFGEYDNSNRRWFKNYNATAVCAIKNPARDSPNEIVGFLCVDNFKGGFDKNITCNTMKLLSTSLFYLFDNLAKMSEIRRSRHTTSSGSKMERSTNGE